ncbi:MAG: hypothetical protein NC433_07690 [Clostridiales bacterium]|nr:hypothetical protein [Clostridiales bacterium]
MSKSALYSFIDNIYTTIADVQDKFFIAWNYQIKNHLCVKESFYIKENVDVFGGFLLSIVQYENMDYELQDFFKYRAEIKEDVIFLRGYEYYCCDSQMHSSSISYTSNELWKKFGEKWANYKYTYSFSFLKQKEITFENWIGILSLLEYIFADLTTLRWFEFINQKKYLNLLGSKFLAIIDETEHFTHIIGDAIAKLLKFDFTDGFNILSSNYSKLFQSTILTDFITASWDFDIEKSAIRVIREGDSLCLIYAAYLLKLAPLCAQKRLNKILLLSNAFGAMNTGIILKYLLPSDIHATVMNIRYSQNRNDIKFYGKMPAKVEMINENLDITEEDGYQAVIIVDDSIFTGNSYHHIKSYFSSVTHIFLLPFSFDCNSLKYGKQEKYAYTQIYEITAQSLKWATEAGNCVPAFISFWDWDKSASVNYQQIKNPEFQHILDGEDLLLKHLWSIYLNK